MKINKQGKRKRNLSKNAFTRKLKQILFNILGSQDSYRFISDNKKCKVLVIFSLTVFFQLT